MIRNPTAVAIFCSLLLVSGCAGRAAAPIAQYQPQDQQLTCQALQRQIESNQAKILALTPKQNKSGKNAALGITGTFLLAPWLLMDFSDAERLEVHAFQLRNSHLCNLYHYRQCPTELRACCPVTSATTIDKKQ
jgi:hypothetical protein